MIRFFVFFFLALTPIQFTVGLQKYDLSPLTHEEIQKLYNEYRNMDLNWDIPEYGCQARAEIFSYLAEKYGSLKIAKVMVSSEDPQKDFVLSSESKDRHQCYKWSFHVAPVLYFRGNNANEADFYVIDPALFEGPVTLREWKNSFSTMNPQLKLKTNIVSRFKTIPYSLDTKWAWDKDEVDGAKAFLDKQKEDYSKSGHLSEAFVSCNAHPFFDKKLSEQLQPATLHVATNSHLVR